MKEFKNFGVNAFNTNVMCERLPRPVFVKWQETIKRKDALDRVTADAIAHAMKEWALEKGCTHYTHWFQPLNGLTAEKHEAFIDSKEGIPISCFSSKELIKGEPDASSFPSGGLRATFEARGYTYWDCTSPVFIRNKVLFIPTIFVSFNGESLDVKAPLIRSIEAISKEASKLYNLLSEEKIDEVIPHIGLEQEYFLVDRNLFLKRKDLLLTGHTLFGALPPKSQELESHYFGSIPRRVQLFMEEVDEELWKLGIYAKSEHNEVAPAQYEIAPLFADANIAVDQNQIIMEVLQEVALKHDLVCLLHEKPFKGVNGSGKHNNWSLITDGGKNLLDPGHCPSDNTIFLLLMAGIIEAIDENATLIRLASSNPGNDERLGANEAPPAIVSMFLGKPLERALLNLIDETKEIDSKTPIFRINSLSYLPRDLSDRNRTSPIAFTGNKIEFRMLGSSLNAANFNTIINAIVAASFKNINAKLVHFDKKQIKNEATKLAQSIIKKHQRVLFDGDGYSKSWLKESDRRGLPNIQTFFKAISVLKDDKTIELFDSLQVFTRKELLARAEVLYEQHNKIRLIDAKTTLLMLYRNIMPSIINEIKLISSIKENKKKISLEKVINELQLDSDLLENRLNNLESVSQEELGIKIIDEVLPITLKIREKYDKIENSLSEQNLPFPTYLSFFFGLDF